MASVRSGMRLLSELLLFGGCLLVCSCTGESEPEGPTDKCIPSDCSPRGLNCGTVRDEQGQCLQCGVCTAPDSCGGGGTLNVCGCSRKTACESGDCGQAPDGCGGTLSCGDSCPEPLTCGGSGAPGRCGRTVGPGEACGTSDVACPQGYSCCGQVGAESCITEAPGGGCPRVAPDLVLDREMFQRSVRVQIEDLAKNPPEPCVRAVGCEFASGRLFLLTFETAMINIGSGDLTFGPETSGPPLFEPGECTGSRGRFVTWRLRTADGQVHEGKLAARCIEDSERRDVSAAPSHKYTCGSGGTPGLQRGWAYRFDSPSGRDCQAIDVSQFGGVATLELEVNADGILEELRVDNNVITTTISLR